MMIPKLSWPRSWRWRAVIALTTLFLVGYGWFVAGLVAEYSQPGGIARVQRNAQREPPL